MRAVLGAAILLLAPLALPASASAATPRHYDCTKAGNANKAACKGATPAPAASPAPAVTPTPAAKAARNYDCSKAGNANKAVCKTAAKAPPPSSPMAAAPVAPQTTASSSSASQPAATGGAPRVVAWTEKNGKVVHYDCSKRGNFNKKACKQ